MAKSSTRTNRKPNNGTQAAAGTELAELPAVAGEVDGSEQQAGSAVVDFDPAALGDSGAESDSGDSRTPGKRGRKPGGKNKVKRDTEKEALDLTELLLSVHGMLAVKIPEMELAEEEAQKLGRAVQRVNELYDFKVLSEKQAAWVQLVFAAGQVYGPRFVAIGNRVAEEKEAKRKAAGPQLVGQSTN